MAGHRSLTAVVGVIFGVAALSVTGEPSSCCARETPPGDVTGVSAAGPAVTSVSADRIRAAERT